MMNQTELNTLKEKATFSEEVLNQYVQRMRDAYNPIESHHWATPAQMLDGLQDLFSQGYTPANELLHSITPPLFYMVYLNKPLSVQQTELLEVVTKARKDYADSVEAAKAEYIAARAEYEWRLEEEKQQVQLEKAKTKRLEQIKKQVEGEFQ